MLLKLLLLLLTLQYGSQITICDQHHSCDCNKFTKSISCDCKYLQDLIISIEWFEDLRPSEFTTLKIANCKKVKLISNWIPNDSQLKGFHVENVSDLYLAPSSFTTHTDHNSVTLVNCTTHKIPQYTFSGTYKTILLDQMKIIENIDSFAFINLVGSQITIRNSIIPTIINQALKLITVGTLNFMNNTIGNLSSSAFVRITVGDKLLFDANTINSLIASKTFKAIDSKGLIEFKNNKFNGFLDQKAFEFNIQHNQIQYISNYFSDLGDNVFSAITGNLSSLRFYNNTLKSFKKNSLAISMRSHQIELINIDVSCKCNEIQEWFRKIDRISFGKCLGGSKISHYWDENCTGPRVYALMVIFAIAVAVFLIVVVSCFLLVRNKKQQKKYSVVVPDGRTYKQVELQVVFDKVTAHTPLTTVL